MVDGGGVERVHWWVGRKEVAEGQELYFFGISV
jgi:hypothetical protein